MCITSISRPRTARFHVRFKLERNPIRRRPTCATAFRACATSCRRVDEPVIAKVEADANPDHLGGLLVRQAFGAGSHRRRQPHRQAAPADLPGAADVRVFGERKFAMRIWLDRDRLAAYN
jgi:multidrug efflux pump